MNNGHALLLILVMAAVTFFLRALPFIAFRKHTPAGLLYLGRVLPYAVMGILVVYCLRNTSFLSGNHGIPEAAACLTVLLLHKWKHNTILSIVAGTVVYMILLQLVFG